MSINLSVSNNKNTGCYYVLKNLMKAGIDCRTIETNSLVGNKLEKGCFITISDTDTSKSNVKKIWNNINQDYTCSHLKIDGVFSGCIYDYISSDNCPG